ncbi:MAG: PDZ domain-containing protein [Candidatus Aminicenantes bacterium]|jgi:serine protease Do
MKKIIVMIFIILLVLITGNLKAEGQTSHDISKLEAEIKGILKTVSPSILKVVTENHRKNFATGIAIDASHVISNINVVKHPYKYVYIQTVKGKKISAKVVGKDKASSLILLKINENALTPIKHAPDYEVGDWIALVGAFYKEFPSIYQGILSSESEEQLILNAPVVPGSSGGAAVNKKGELIGVIRGRVGFAVSPDYTFKDHSGEIRIEIPKSLHKDLCAAVPMVKVLDIYQDLKKYGKVKRGWLGVSMDYKDGKVQILQVVKSSPAEKAGIRKGDFIKKINGKTIKTTGDVQKIVRGFKPEQKVKMELTRENKPQSALVVIGELKKGKRMAARSYKYYYNQGVGVNEPFPEFRETLPVPENFVYRLGGSRILGVEVAPLTPELAKEFSVEEGTGLMVTRVHKATTAEKAGLRPADIIVKVGNQRINNNNDLRKALDELEDNEAVLVELYRKGKIKKIKVVPDKRQGQGFSFIFERFRDTMKDINVHIEEEEKKKIEEQARKEYQKLQQIRESYLKELELIKKKELEKYKIQMQKMLKEQEQMRKEIEKLKQELEKEKKEKEKQKE